MAKAIQISEVQDGDHVRTTVLLDDGRIFYRYSENNWKEIVEAPWMKEAPAPPQTADHEFVFHLAGDRCGQCGGDYRYHPFTREGAVKA